MGEAEIQELISQLAERPMQGDEIPGTGGCRKIRVAAPGIGKRGGYRVITFFSGKAMPVFLLTVFGKREKVNLTEREKAALKVLTGQIVQEYQGRIVQAQAGTNS